MKTWMIDWLGSIAWIAFPDERMQRASSAIVVNGGCLVCDPVDGPGVDEAIAGLGRVLGVCTLLDRHGRDSEAFAARHRAPLVAPDEVPSFEAFEGIEPIPLYRARRWQETALWVSERGLLVVPEAVGTIPFFLARPGDRLGMHPLARLRPPRVQLARIDPTTVAVGHGEPVIGDAGIELARALSGARRDLPRAFVTIGETLVSR